MVLISRIHQLVADGAQFIIYTHSPILMAYPKATIFSLEDQDIRKVSYKETEHYAVTRQFLANPEAMLDQLLND